MQFHGAKKCAIFRLYFYLYGKSSSYNKTARSDFGHFLLSRGPQKRCDAHTLVSSWSVGWVTGVCLARLLDALVLIITTST
jgi:hypothetical protein